MPDARILVDRLASAGHEAVAMPVLGIAPVDARAPIDATMTRLGAYRLVVFVSANAIRHALATKRPWPRETWAAVMGPSSRAVLAAHADVDDACVLMPAVADDHGDVARLDSEALLATIVARFAHGPHDGRPVLIVKGEGGRAWLAARLRERGHVVETLDCYRRVRPSIASDVAATIARRADAGDVVEFVVTSSEGLEHLAAMADEMLASSGDPTMRDEEARSTWLRACPIHVPHARIAENASRLGFADVRVTGPGDDGIVASIK